MSWLKPLSANWTLYQKPETGRDGIKPGRGGILPPDRSIPIVINGKQYSSKSAACRELKCSWYMVDRMLGIE